MKRFHCRNRKMEKKQVKFSEHVDVYDVDWVLPTDKSWMKNIEGKKLLDIRDSLNDFQSDFNEDFSSDPENDIRVHAESRHLTR